MVSEGDPVALEMRKVLVCVVEQLEGVVKRQTSSDGDSSEGKCIGVYSSAAVTFLSLSPSLSLPPSFSLPPTLHLSLPPSLSPSLPPSLLLLLSLVVGFVLDHLRSTVPLAIIVVELQ